MLGTLYYDASENFDDQVQQTSEPVQYQEITASSGTSSISANVSMHTPPITVNDADRQGTC